MRILLIEDDRDLCLAMALSLEKEGYRTDQCHSGPDALLYLEEQVYDCLVLDRMLPGIDGLTVLELIRRKKIHTPVILATALGSLNDRILGLDTGADDYLVKPYAIEELMARIRALSRRPRMLAEHETLSYLDISFNPDGRLLICKGKELRLSGREALLLEFFLKNPEKTLAREQIFNRVWGPDGIVEDGNLDTYIYFLRKHLRTLKSRTVIRTVHGLGYRMEDSYVS